MPDDKTGDGLPPPDLTDEDANDILKSRSWSKFSDARELLQDVYAMGQCSMREYAAAAVAMEREKWKKVYRISIPTATMEQEIATHVRRAAARERELCAQVCDARDMGDGSREDQEARRCAAAIRGRG